MAAVVAIAPDRCCVPSIRLRASLAETWALALRAANKAPKTVRSYTGSLARLEEFLGARSCPLCCSRFDLDAFMADQLESRKSSTAATRYRGLQQLFPWAVSVGLRPDNPMDGMSPPPVEDRRIPVLSDEDVRATVGATSGFGFRDVRDRAIVELFASTPMRLSELANLRLTDLTDGAVIVVGKGNRPRLVPYDDAASRALDAWLGERSTHRQAGLDWLWLGLKGRLTVSGVDQALRRRARAGGVQGLHAHQFRHTFAHQWLLTGEREGDLMTLAGWRSRQMLDRYGAAAAEERAVRAYRRTRVGGATSAGERATA